MSIFRRSKSAAVVVEQPPAAAAAPKAPRSGVFAATCTCDIALDVDENRKTAPLTKMGMDKGERVYIYTDGEDVSGSVVVNIKAGKKVDHQGIKVELVGQVVSGEKSPQTQDFSCTAQHIEPPGSLSQTQTFRWSFRGLDTSCETYYGKNAMLRYFVRVSVLKTSATSEVDFAVQNPLPQPDLNQTIQMEVGIEDVLHIEFEYNKSKYHMKDIVVGRVYFHLVRIKIKHMELNINRVEVTGPLGKEVTEKETIAKFEIMDGAPVKDQCVPVRFHLSGCNLTPSFKNVQGKFSVKYFLSVVMVDEEDRRYFKQSEITLYRKVI